MPAVEPGDELGLPWEKWADGRVHRLKKGKHFLRTSKEVQEAAANASERIGRPVQVVADMWNDKSFVWLQFADAQIMEGEPCVCGSSMLERANPVHAVCRSCGSTVIVVKPKPERTVDPAIEDEELLRLLEPLLIFARPKGKRGAAVSAAAGVREALAGVADAVEAPALIPPIIPAARIRKIAAHLKLKGEPQPDLTPVVEDGAPKLHVSDFTEVELTLFERNVAGEKYLGTGVDSSGRKCLIVVLYPWRDGMRIEGPDFPTGVQHYVLALPAEPGAAQPPPD